MPDNQFKWKDITGDVFRAYMSQIPDVEEINKKLVDFIHTFDKYEDSNTNPHSFQTPWDIRSKETDHIKKHVFSMLKHSGYSEQFICYELFGNVYKTGDSNVMHIHHGADFTFNYYVKCPENSSPTVFSTSKRNVPAKEGRLVIFPGHIKHHVPKSSHQGERITLTGNLRAIDPRDTQRFQNDAKMFFVTNTSNEVPARDNYATEN